MKHINESIRNKRGGVTVKLEPGDIIKIEGDAHPFEYMLIMTAERYNQIYPGIIGVGDFPNGIVVYDRHGGCFSPEVWDKDLKNTDPDFLEHGDVVAVYKNVIPFPNLSHKFWDSDSLEKIVRQKDVKPIIVR